MSENLKGVLAASFTALLWGVLAVLMKIALAYVGPLEIAWFRFSLAALILLLYFVIAKPRLLNIVKSFPFILFIAAVCLGFNYIGYIYGLHYTSPSTAQVVIQIGPILLALSGIVFFKEKVNKWQTLGFIIASLGLLLFYYNQLKIFVAIENFTKGFIWIAFAAFSWTIYAILQKKLVAIYDPQLLNLFIYGIPALLLVPLVDYNSFTGLNPSQWLLLVFLGLNTLLAYGALAIAFKYTQAYKVSIIITLNPIITLIIMTFIYYFGVSWIEGEKLSLISSIGAFLLLIGAVMIVYFSKFNKIKKH